MNLEQRLQHAARDLREVPVAVPPLGTVAAGRRRSRVHTTATSMLVPLLFVAGALLAIGATRAGIDPSVRSDLPPVSDSVDPATAVPVDAGTGGDAPTVDTPSALVELQLIADVVGSARTAEPPGEPVATPIPPTGPNDSRVTVIGAV